MLQVDILSGYLICGVGSFVAAGMLRLAKTTDLPLNQALRNCGWCFVILGISLMPAGLGLQHAAHPLAQWMMTAGSIAALAVLARGMGLLLARDLQPRWVATIAATGGLCCALAGWVDARLLGQAYPALMSALTALVLWQARGFIRSPRDTTERILGATLALLGLTMLLRWALTLADHGPVRGDLMYVPQGVDSAYAVLYGVLPMVVATLLLNMVNARLRVQLHTRALTDELTGALTRRALREQAPALIVHEQLRQRQVAVMMLDLDAFKAINDGHGHAAGDAVLRTAAALLQAQVRAEGLLARYGGEEFVAIVPVGSLPVARRIAERLRTAIADADWSHALGTPRGVTVSIGVSVVGPHEPLDQALHRADEALYRAKRNGRNQCQVSLMAA